MDYWALGVLAFEMVDGKTPFFAERPMDVYEKILEGKYKMPPHCSGHLENIIHLLLRPNQGKRLGNGKGGVEAINDHRFFAGYTYISARVPIKVEKAEDSDESDVENYFVEDEEEKGDDVAPEPRPGRRRSRGRRSGSSGASTAFVRSPPHLKKAPVPRRM